jgi:4-amino-4-deoxy-L-arabinose transferase-like glycosyltransferase
MPLPSILAAAGYALGGTFTGAQLFFGLLAGLLPLLAYAISQKLSGERWQAWAAALFTAAGGFYASFFSQPSTFAPFAWSGAFCLLALGLASRQNLEVRAQPGSNSTVAQRDRQYLWWLVAGLAAGLAHLTRADGVLLLLVGLIIWGLGTWGRQPRGRDWKWAILLLLAGYFLVMGGWFLRNWLVIGRPLSTAGVQSIFLTSYDDLFAFGRSADLETFLVWGWNNILRSRAAGVLAGIQTYLAIPGLIFLAPFVLIGLVHHYRSEAGRTLLRPMIIYAVALFLSASLLFTFPGMRGSLLHSSVALWPWAMALAPSGIAAAIDWAAGRLSHWQPERARRIFAGLFIAVAFVLSLSVSLPRLSPVEDPELFRQVGAILPKDAVVMIGNAPALNYYTGLASLSVPNEPVLTVLEAAERYGVTHLVLNENRPLPLDDLYRGRVEHPRLQKLQTIGADL